MNGNKLTNITIAKLSRGFTLVELAIVLVIVGLLIGGVLQGQELIEQARQRNIIKQMNSYVTSIRTFQSKYNGLPGDLKNGYLFFASNLGCTNAIIATNANAPTAGCNGNGSGQIAEKTMANSWQTEGQLAWAHLSASGLINEVIPINTAITQKPGTNVPNSSSYNGGVSVYTNLFDDWLTGGSFTEYGTWFVLGKEVVGNPVCNGIVSPETAMSVDLKVDNGLPSKGIVEAVNGYTGNNVYQTGCTSANTANANYTPTATTDTVCVLGFRM